MIRTKLRKLDGINGYTYRQKLNDGSIHIVIIAPKTKVAAVLSPRGGKWAKYNKKTEPFTPEVFDEAVRLTADEPYISAGSVKMYANSRLKEESPEKDTDYEKTCDLERTVVEGAEYQAIVSTYCDADGKFAWARFNKDFIQFAANSSVVRKMLTEKASIKSIITYMVRSKAAKLSGNEVYLSDDEIRILIGVLDTMNIRSAFKEVRAYLKSRAAKLKKA